MYDTDEIRLLINKAKNILQQPSLYTNKETTTILKEIIQFADWSYYVKDNPILADQEYDQLFSILKKIESIFPETITKDSPTQRIAKGLTKDFPTVNHLVPMLSLENSYNAQDLYEWDRKCKELSGEAKIQYCIEPKYDGAGISLLYENDFLQRGATRGDGIQGDDITINTKQIRSIPLKAFFSKYQIGQIEIRGEIMMTKKSFKIYNEKLIAENIAPLANPRNAASGSLRMKDPNEVAQRGLDAFLYHVSYLQLENDDINLNSFSTHYDSLKTLSSLGFKTPIDNMKVCDSIEEVITICNEFEEQRDSMPYEIDGMVIKVNSFSLQEKIGQTSHHPRWAIAYKFKARQATSKLLNIEYQVGRTGSITPVAKIEPVYIGGVTVSSISLFNEDVIREKDLMIGDTILVERAGDVIPYIVKSFPELRNGNEQAIIFPKQCPVCHQELIKPEGEAVWRCTHVNCEAQVIERIIHFASKDAMDIKGLGDALVRRFFDLGFLKKIQDIYNLPYQQIQQLEGLGEKSINNLKLAIEKSKCQALHRIIFGLGIRYVGETTAKAMARSVLSIKDFYNKTIEELKNIEDVGDKVAASIIDFFSHPDTKILIEDLEKAGVNFKNEKTENENSNALFGKTFLFTGTLQMKRSEAEAIIESLGGKILSGVSSKLNYLIVGKDAGSKLEKAKKLSTINILNENEFLELVKFAK